mmetsp:Transcript_637/g.906  ORF Transcript_637/g.906 Transcript_637/m.906 type:complete len:81 (-) Transcript_637:32-274(-)
MISILSVMNLMLHPIPEKNLKRWICLKELGMSTNLGRVQPQSRISNGNLFSKPRKRLPEALLNHLVVSAEQKQQTHKQTD